MFKMWLIRPQLWLLAALALSAVSALSAAPVLLAVLVLSAALALSAVLALLAALALLTALALSAALAALVLSVSPTSLLVFHQKVNVFWLKVETTFMLLIWKFPA